MNRIEIVNEKVKSESYSGAIISKFIAVESEFLNCSFENMKIEDVCFGGGIKQTRYVNCSFDNSVFSSNAPGIARFENCSFKNVQIRNFFCVDVDFVNCIFSGEIKKGNFVGVHSDVDGSSKINEYINNNFEGLKIGDVGFSNIDLTMQTFSLNSTYAIILDVSYLIKIAKSELHNILDQTLYCAVSKVITILEYENEESNNQMLIDRNSFPDSLIDAVSLVISLHRTK
jgi:hypothetical protein